MTQLNHNELEAVTPIKKQIVKAMSEHQLSHFWHIETQTLLSFAENDEAIDDYNDQIEASPEDYLQVISDSNMSEQVLAEKFISENLENSASNLAGKTTEELFAELPELQTNWTAYRESFYENLAQNWLVENGLLG